MIPESAGATPLGIFILADDFLRAARLVAAANGRLPEGPVRLLVYHSAELFLKTYMRSAGETVVALRNQGHDLPAMVDRALALGLKLPPQIVAQARKVAVINDYVRVRYVTEQRRDLSLDSTVRFSETIRSCVVAGLNLDENGVPLGRHWLGEPPSDYSGVIRN